MPASQAGTADDKTAEAELAKKLANPVTSHPSVPVRYNYDEYSGINDGASVDRLLIQPVIPFSLNEDWNLITRTIFQGVDQHDFPLEAMNVSGFGDTTASQFFSPKAPTANGWIWGLAPPSCCPLQVMRCSAVKSGGWVHRPWCSDKRGRGPSGC